MQKTLALVMVVKNEEKGLEKAILSCKDFVDEIIIAVDSKSSDGTLDIAKKHATEYKIFEFDDDFSEARNFAQEGVKSDWILYLDGHEYIEKCEKLQEYLNLDCDGLLITMRMENGTEFRNPRIYKNGLKFVGRIHEHPECTKTFLCLGVVAKHNRTEGQAQNAIEERDQQRNFQMQEVMLKELEKNPKDLRVLFHMACWYQTINDIHNALKYQNLYLKYSKNHGDRYYVYFIRSMLFMGRNRLFRAFWAINQADCEEPERWETEKMKGMLFFSKKQYEKALVHLVNSFQENKKDFAYKPLPRDNAGTWNLIGECFYRRGIYDKASEAFMQASGRSAQKDKIEFFKNRSNLMAKMFLGR